MELFESESDDTKCRPPSLELTAKSNAGSKLLSTLTTFLI